jgi:hypothetical protein
MAIASSVFAKGQPQGDGRVWVYETHTDQLGGKYYFSYLASAATDPQPILTARANQLETDLAFAEVAANASSIVDNGSLATLSFNHSTAGQLRAALRALYASAQRATAIMIGDFLSSLSDAQLQAAFGMTAGQVANLRTNKLTPAANAAATIRAASGN